MTYARVGNDHIATSMKDRDVPHNSCACSYRIAMTVRVVVGNINVSFREEVNPTVFNKEFIALSSLLLTKFPMVSVEHLKSLSLLPHPRSITFSPTY